jgi:hypothetical protein
MSDLDRARVRILRGLRITEVSSVDRAANGDARITLYKRDDDVASDNDGNGDGDEAYAAALHYLMSTPHGAAVVRRVFPRGPSGTADIEHLARLVANVMRTRADNGDNDAPSDPHQPWADVIGDDAETEDDDEETEDEEIEKVFSMSNRDEVLKAAVRRDGGVVPLCKRICANGAGDISEQELTQLLTEHAQQLYPEMSPASAFAKLFTSPGAEPLRRAVSICKGMLDIEPVHVAVGSTDTDDDSRKAYEHLQRLALHMRKRLPALSTSQAFERAGRDRPDLLARAVPRR